MIRAVRKTSANQKIRSEPVSSGVTPKHRTTTPIPFQYMTDAARHRSTRSVSNNQGVLTRKVLNCLEQDIPISCYGLSSTLWLNQAQVAHRTVFSDPAEGAADSILIVLSLIYLASGLIMYTTQAHSYCLHRSLYRPPNGAHQFLTKRANFPHKISICMSS